MSKAPKAQRGAHPDGASRDGRWGECSSWCVPEGRFECWLKRNTPTFCSIECPRTASQSPCLRARERDLERQLRLDACWTTAPSIYDGLVRHEKNTKGRSTRGGTPCSCLLVRNPTPPDPSSIVDGDLLLRPTAQSLIHGVYGSVVRVKVYKHGQPSCDSSVVGRSPSALKACYGWQRLNRYESASVIIWQHADLILHMFAEG